MKINLRWRIDSIRALLRALMSQEDPGLIRIIRDKVLDEIHTYYDVIHMYLHTYVQHIIHTYIRTYIYIYIYIY